MMQCLPASACLEADSSPCSSQIDKVQAIIPHDSPRLVYDIKYARESLSYDGDFLDDDLSRSLLSARDYRRHGKYTSRAVDAKAPLDLDKMFASAPVLPAEVKEIARPPIMPNRGF